MPFFISEPVFVSRCAARTGLSVWDHQLKTVASYLNLMTLDAELPWMPVLQGFTLDEYLRCADQYGRAGVDLTPGIPEPRNVPTPPEAQ